MAYVDQAKKAKIAAALKNVVPKDWKYTLRIRHHSEIIMTIRKSPIDFIAIAASRLRQDIENKGLDLTDPYLKQYLSDLEEKKVNFLTYNIYYLENHFSGELLELMRNIVDCLNTDNYDRSDSQIDYFDVGHYVTLQVGEFDKPYQCSK